MIRLTCPGCQSHLNAKEELIGQTRKCPKCGTQIVIAAPEVAAEPDLAEWFSESPKPPAATAAEPAADKWFSEAPEPSAAAASEPVADNWFSHAPEPPATPAAEPAADKWFSEAPEPSTVPAPSAAAAPEPAASSASHDASIVPEQALHSFRGPERLTRLNQYAICNNTAVVAVWQNNGHGWMLNTAAGLISASRNNEKIPTSGSFQLVELQMKMCDDKLRLSGMLVYRLANRWSLMSLSKGDDAVLTTVVGAGSLNRDQKAAVRRHLREHVMYAIWEHAAAVLDYLASVDYHSPGVSMASAGE